MPIGEDIPMLVPVSIILTVIVLFLFGTFTSITEKNDLIRMSQVSLDTVDYLANIKFGNGFGGLDYSKFTNKNSCKGLDKLNITVNYRMKINISDYSTGEWWCWRNSEDDIGKSIVISVPFVIANNNNTDLGKVTVSVSK